MSATPTSGFETVAEPLTLALIHSVWQGALLAVLLACALALVHRKRAGLRYALSCATLVATVATAAVTGWFLMENAPAPSSMVSLQASFEPLQTGRDADPQGDARFHP